MTSSAETGLLLIGHGSHFHSDSSAPVHAHARRLRDSGTFAEVRVAFWKEEPALSRAIDGFDATEIVAVPVLISGGYFAEEVMPRELRVAPHGTSEVDGLRVRYTAPVGSHPRLADVILQRAREVEAGYDAALVVLGHGTSRSAGSAKNVIAQTERVRETGRYPAVVTAFIDQEPNLRGVWSMVEEEEIVVVPLFIADGWHVGETIPDDLDLAGGINRRGNRRLRIAAAVGTHPAIADVIGALAVLGEPLNPFSFDI